MCGPDAEAEARTKCPGPFGGGGSGTYVPTGGFSGGGRSAGGAGGEAGVGGADGVGEGGAGGSGGHEFSAYLDEEGNCRIDAPFQDLGCPSTYSEALLTERCAAPNCLGGCGSQAIVESPCPPRLRCAYNASSGELEGVVLRSNEAIYCEGQADELIYGEACVSDLEDLCGPN